jgi:hypothetical protein
MITALDGGAALPITVASLRAACEVLRSGGNSISSVSVSGILPTTSGAASPILAAAERLASEFDCGVMMSLDRRVFEVRFSSRR